MHSVKKIDVSKNILTNIEELCEVTTAQAQVKMYCELVKEIYASHNLIEVMFSKK